VRRSSHAAVTHGEPAAAPVIRARAAGGTHAAHLRVGVGEHTDVKSRLDVVRVAPHTRGEQHQVASASVAHEGGEPAAVLDRIVAP
jgi:hypothetical protein